MKVLLDTCVWGGDRERFAAAGHEAEWAGDWPEDPGDEEMLELAHVTGRVLVTLDKDFGELAVVHNRPHRGIIRLVGLSASEQVGVCLTVLNRYRRDLEQGALITATRDRIRIRPGAPS